MSSETSAATCWIVAGPNGAGKTTFALHYLPQVAKCARFINADLIAAGLSPLAPERELLAASRIFLREIEEAIVEGEDFAFETTLSGRGYLSLVQRLLDTGWRVELVYLALPSVEMSRLRVAERVSHGGHNIPLKDIQRRFPRSLHNLLTLYAPSVTRARCFMNAGGLLSRCSSRQVHSAIFSMTATSTLSSRRHGHDPADTGYPNHARQSP